MCHIVGARSATTAAPTTPRAVSLGARGAVAGPTVSRPAPWLRGAPGAAPVTGATGRSHSISIAHVGGPHSGGRATPIAFRRTPRGRMSSPVSASASGPGGWPTARVSGRCGTRATWPIGRTRSRPPSSGARAILRGLRSCGGWHGLGRGCGFCEGDDEYPVSHSRRRAIRDVSSSANLVSLLLVSRRSAQDVVHILSPEELHKPIDGVEVDPRTLAARQLQ